MQLQELYQYIHLQPEIVEKLEALQNSMDWGKIEKAMEQLLDRKTAALAYQHLKAAFEEDEGHFQMLASQLESARRIYSRYEEKQIPKTIYIDTMKCFPRFLEECKKKNGRMFFDRGWWTYRQTSMSLFRIGTLEYEFTEHEGERAVALHIPSDADLSKEAVDASLEQAGIFFRTYFRDYKYNKYTCDSWLLAPVLIPLLSAQSNILSFQKRFDIVRETEEDNEYIEWLYQVPADTPYQELPADTGLQKKVRQLLLAGGSVGSAYGIMRLHEQPNICKRRETWI